MVSMLRTPTKSLRYLLQPSQDQIKGWFVTIFSLTLVIFSSRVQTYRVTWHSSRLFSLFDFSTIPKGKIDFQASGMTPHEPKREWLIGNFSSDCADLARTRFLFSFRCCRTLVASEAIETGLSLRLCRFSIESACIIKIFISRRRSDFWLFGDIRRTRQAAGESPESHNWQKYTLLNLSLATELILKL